jgi:glycosyl transferase family 25
MPSDFNSHFLVQIISTENVIRSKNLKSKLTELGLKFQISPGVVPTEMDFNAELLHSKYLSTLLCQRKLSIGEVGCALAHKYAINEFLNSDHKFGIIFEDDAEIIADFDCDVIVQCLNSNDPVIIALGWIPGFAIAKNSNKSLDDKPVELMTSPTCAFAYAINRPAAKFMAESQKKLIDLADWPIYTLNKVRFYSIHSHLPWVTANHDPKFSIIGDRSISTPKSFIGVLVNRISLAGSLITLFLLSNTNKLDVSPKQIVHRLLIRDMLYKYGNSQLHNKESKYEVIALPLKFQKLLALLKIS